MELLGVGSEADSIRGSSIVSLRKSQQNKKRTKTNSKRNDHHGVNDESSLALNDNMADQTLIPLVPPEQENGLVGENSAFITNQLVIELGIAEAESSVSAPMNNGMEAIFPALGLILNELLQLYQSKANINERNLAIIDYLRLIFHNIK